MSLYFVANPFKKSFGDVPETPYEISPQEEERLYLLELAEKVSKEYMKRLDNDTDGPIVYSPFDRDY